MKKILFALPLLLFLSCAKEVENPILRSRVVGYRVYWLRILVCMSIVASPMPLLPSATCAGRNHSP